MKELLMPEKKIPRLTEECQRRKILIFGELRKMPHRQSVVF